MASEQKHKDDEEKDDEEKDDLECDRFTFLLCYAENLNWVKTYLARPRGVRLSSMIESKITEYLRRAIMNPSSLSYSRKDSQVQELKTIYIDYIMEQLMKE